MDPERTPPYPTRTVDEAPVRLPRRDYTKILVESITSILDVTLVPATVKASKKTCRVAERARNANRVTPGTFVYAQRNLQPFLNVIELNHVKHEIPGLKLWKRRVKMGIFSWSEITARQHLAREEARGGRGKWFGLSPARAIILRCSIPGRSIPDRERCGKGDLGILRLAKFMCGVREPFKKRSMCCERAGRMVEMEEMIAPIVRRSWEGFVERTGKGTTKNALEKTSRGRQGALSELESGR